MKAAIVQEPGVLTVQEIPEPAIIGDYDVLCRMLFGATCTATDQHVIHGRFPWPIEYPTVLGHESIGRAVQVGPRVRHINVGDVLSRVGNTPPPGLACNWGGFTEWGVARDHQAMREDGLPEGEWRPYRVNQLVPPDIDPAAATMLITWRETFSYIQNMGVEAGSRVLIIGSGGTGLSFASHSRNLGATTVAVVGQAARESTAHAVGATHYFDYHSSAVLDELNAIHADGFDFVIDAVGKTGVIDAWLPAVKVGGVFTVYGIDDHGRWSINPARARGTFTYHVGGYDEATVHDQVIAFMRSGALDARHWLNLDTPFALEDINAAFEAVHERRLVKALVKLAD